MDLSARIYSIRKSLSMSQEKFGELVGMSQRSVAAWESGERSPSFATLSALADKVGVSVDYLLGRSEDPHGTKKEQPAQKGELLEDVISRIQALPDPALSRVSDFLAGLTAGQEIAAGVPAAADPDAEPSQ